MSIGINIIFKDNFTRSSIMNIKKSSRVTRSGQVSEFVVDIRLLKVEIYRLVLKRGFEMLTNYRSETTDPSSD